MRRNFNQTVQQKLEAKLSEYQAQEAERKAGSFWRHPLNRISAIFAARAQRQEEAARAYQAEQTRRKQKVIQFEEKNEPVTRLHHELSEICAEASVGCVVLEYNRPYLQKKGKFVENKTPFLEKSPRINVRSRTKEIGFNPDEMAEMAAHEFSMIRIDDRDKPGWYTFICMIADNEFQIFEGLHINHPAIKDPEPKKTRNEIIKVQEICRYQTYGETYNFFFEELSERIAKQKFRHETSWLRKLGL